MRERAAAGEIVYNKLQEHQLKYLKEHGGDFHDPQENSVQRMGAGRRVPIPRPSRSRAFRGDRDGSVTMEIQGTEEQIDGVIEAIGRGRYVKIENMDVRTIPVIDHEQGFWTKWN